MWDKGHITNSGIEILQSVTGGGTLALTSAAAGSGTMTDTQMANATNVQTRETSVGISLIERSSVGLKIVLHITPKSTAYTCRQVGLFGKLNGGAEKLVALWQDDTGINVPALDSMPEYLFALTVVIKMQDGSGTVTASVPGGIYMQISDYDADGDGIADTANALTIAGKNDVMTGVRSITDPISARIQAIEAKLSGQTYAFRIFDNDSSCAVIPNGARAGAMLAVNGYSHVSNGAILSEQPTKIEACGRNLIRTFSKSGDTYVYPNGGTYTSYYQFPAGTYTTHITGDSGEQITAFVREKGLNAASIGRIDSGAITFTATHPFNIYLNVGTNPAPTGWYLARGTQSVSDVYSGTDIDISNDRAAYFPNGMLSCDGASDTLDYENMRAVQRVDSVKINNANKSNVYARDAKYSTLESVLIAVTDIWDTEGGIFAGTKRKAICDRFTRASSDIASDRSTPWVFDFKANDGNTCYFRIPAEDLGIEELSNNAIRDAARAWFASHETTVLYELNRPVITKMDAEGAPIFNAVSGGIVKVCYDGNGIIRSGAACTVEFTVKLSEV